MDGWSEWKQLREVTQPVPPPIPPKPLLLNASHLIEGSPTPIGRDLDLEGGYWISDRGDHFHIPNYGKHAPHAALSIYFDDIADVDTEVADFVRRALRKFPSNPSQDEWEAWEVIATFLMMRKWHLLWQGTVHSRLPPEEAAQIISSIELVKSDLAWPNDASIQYRQLEEDDTVRELYFTWSYFSDARLTFNLLKPAFDLPQE